MRRDSIKATCADAAAIREVRSPLGSRIARWAPVPLRLIVGYGFMEHGFAKLGRGPEAFADILHTIGVPGPHVMAWATILTEVIGGLAVILGVRGAGRLTDGCAFGRGDLYRASALRVQFHQAL